MKQLLTESQRKIILDAIEIKEGRKSVSIDLDGVVADFDKSAERGALELGISPDEFISQKLYRKPKFYLDLEPIPGAIESIMELDKYFYIRFLSAPSWGNPDSFTEKRLWIERYFGEWGEKRMDLTFRKDNFLCHFLIDDRLKYGAGDGIGEHIMYGSESFPTWESVSKYLINNHVLKH
jgi:5'(3')-deoxyribonucleotidase